jgi:ferredoxin
MAQELLIDRTRCVGHGSCAELLPELLTLDEWGYPSNPAGPVGTGLLRYARRAVTTCPVLALRLVEPAGARH